MGEKMKTVKDWGCELRTPASDPTQVETDTGAILPLDSNPKTNNEHGIDQGEQLLRQDKNSKQKNQIKVNQAMKMKIKKSL
jgi:hypothetical protein